jgi:hypothetical protein
MGIYYCYYCYYCYYYYYYYYYYNYRYYVCIILIRETTNKTFIFRCQEKNSTWTWNRTSISLVFCSTN